MTDADKNRVIADAIGEDWAWKQAWGGWFGARIEPADFASPEVTLKLIEWAANKNANWWNKPVPAGQWKHFNITAQTWAAINLTLIASGSDLRDACKRIRDIIYEALKGKGGGE